MERLSHQITGCGGVTSPTFVITIGDSIVKKSQSPFPRQMANRAAPISVSIALGHASANVVKVTAGGWSTGSIASLTFPLHSHMSRARREGNEYHFKSLWYDSTRVRTHDLPFVRQTLYHWAITPVVVLQLVGKNLTWRSFFVANSGTFCSFSVNFVSTSPPTQKYFGKLLQRATALNRLVGVKDYKHIGKCYIITSHSTP